MRVYVCFFFALILTIALKADAQLTTQSKQYTRADTLRGSIGPGRVWWDVSWYGIEVKPDYTDKSLTGNATIRFRTIAKGRRMQLDLQAPMEIKSVQFRGNLLEVQRDGNAWFIDFPELFEPGKNHEIQVAFQGKPKIAVQPPWDGGWIFTRDKKGRPWMSVACQGLGASVWMPCKDHQADEPDSMQLSITVPDTLTAIANGRLRSVASTTGRRKTWTWAVSNPINTYNIVPYIGVYDHWEDSYSGEKGRLDRSFWVLDYQLEKAKNQFKQVDTMLRCFENWFGPYPFYEDGFKLVESPHLGMEHQSAVAYGNGFVNGYRGQDLSRTGLGLKWDFIIIHESGHEWFGNNISAKDIADMWIHESFTNYSETIYTACQSGLPAGNAYLIGTRKLIENQAPIVGPYGVNEEGSGDMYYKGGNMIHYMRQLIGNDSLFRMGMRGMNERFRHQTVTYEDILTFWNLKTGKNFTKLFDQYLRDIRIPELQWNIKGNKLKFRWANCMDGYDVPVRVYLQGFAEGIWLNPGKTWKTIDLAGKKKPSGKTGQESGISVDPKGYENPALIIDPNLYCTEKRVR
jgi:aminopeptidase N